jgi:amidase
VTLAFLPALEQARLVRDGEVSSRELVQLYLDRIERFDGELKAYVTVVADQALSAAEAPPPGPFSGVPLPIKDLVETAGIRTTFSCKALANYVPTQDAELVRRLRAAGFVVIGKTNTASAAIPGVRGTLPAARAAVPRRRSPQAWPRSRRAPTAAARSASRARAAGSTGSSRPAGGSRPRPAGTRTG